MKDGCHNCKFVGRQGNAGICRRYPPTLVQFPEGFGAQFPPLMPDLWCGEFIAASRVAIAQSIPQPSEVSKLM